MSNINQEQIIAWHTHKPDWATKLTAAEWGLLDMVAEKLDEAQASPLTMCLLPPAGWYCTREGGHEGPCAAYPLEGN